MAMTTKINFSQPYSQECAIVNQLPLECYYQEFLKRLALKDFISLSSTCTQMFERYWSEDNFGANLKCLWDRYFPLTPAPQNWNQLKLQRTYAHHCNWLNGRFTTKSCRYDIAHNGLMATRIFWNGENYFFGYLDGWIMTYNASGMNLKMTEGRAPDKITAIVKKDRLIVAGLANRSICMWDQSPIDNDPQIFQAPDHEDYSFYTNEVFSLAISNDQKIYFGHQNGWLGIVDKNDLTKKSYEEHQLRKTPIVAIDFYEENLVCGYSDGIIEIRELKELKTCWQTFETHDKLRMSSLRIDSHKLCANLDDGSFEIWNINNREYLGRFLGARSLIDVTNSYTVANSQIYLDLKNSQLLFYDRSLFFRWLNFECTELDVLKEIANLLYKARTEEDIRPCVTRFYQMPEKTKKIIYEKLSKILNKPVTEINGNDQIELAYAISWYFSLPTNTWPEDPNIAILKNIAFWLKIEDTKIPAYYINILEDLLFIFFNDVTDEIRENILRINPEIMNRIANLGKNALIDKAERFYFSNAITLCLSSINKN